ncbi:MAG: tetratricopeptide repeat protein, partial [Syntrophales bacterium]
GNYNLAIGDFNRAIDIKPKYADAYKNRGIAYNSLGNHNQAIEDFKIASRLGNKASQDFLRRQGINW